MSEEISNTTTTTSGHPGKIDGFLFGRRDIFTAIDELTEENVVIEVNRAIGFHLMNVMEEDYLYWYRRGFQPVLNRTKDRNEFILNKVVENHAQEVVDFKNGYLFQESLTYIPRRPGVKGKVGKLNEYLYRSGKQQADNDLADWFHTVGKAVLFVEPDDDPERPIKAYAIDPRSAFVVYSMRPGNKPVYACNIAVIDNDMYVDVFTKDNVYRLFGRYTGQKTTAYPNWQTVATSLVGTEPNPLRHIPIIEYRYNSVNMAAFEAAISLLDEINNVQSNRVDGVEQFIQSIAVAVNCQFEEGTTASQIKQAGMIALKSIGENKADFKILSEELNQDQTQTLVDDLYDKVLLVCAMPMTARKGAGAYDSTGRAAIFNNGWEQAAASARATEEQFFKSNAYFDRIFTDVLRRKGLLDINPVDFELSIVRNETAGVQSKAQALQTMLAAGMAPELAFAKSGITNDPVSDVKMSDPYLKMIWGDPAKADQTEQQTNGQGEATIIEQDADNGENVSGGSV